VVRLGYIISNEFIYMHNVILWERGWGSGLLVETARFARESLAGLRLGKRQRAARSPRSATHNVIVWEWRAVGLRL